MQAQVVLQLAEWMAATGQGVKEEITGGGGDCSAPGARSPTALFQYRVGTHTILT